MWGVATRGLVRGVVVGVVAGPILLVPVLVLYVEFAPSLFYPSTSVVAMRGMFFGIIGGAIIGAPVGIVSMVAWWLFQSKGKSRSIAEDDVHS